MGIILIYNIIIYMGDHITVQYVVEIPGHDADQHASHEIRTELQHDMGTAMGTHMTTENFDSQAAIIDYQNRGRNVVNLYDPGQAMDEPTLIYGQTVIDTSGATSLDPFHKSLLDLAYVQNSNAALESSGAGRQYVIGSANSNYLYSLGIDPSFVRATGSAAVDLDVLDPDLSMNNARQQNAQGNEIDVHMTEARDSWLNTYQLPADAPNVVSTLTQFNGGTPEIDPDEDQRHTGDVLMAVGGGSMATGGMLAASNYLSANALGSSAVSTETAPLIAAGLEGGAMNPLVAGGGSTETSSLLAAETTINPVSSSYNANPSRPGLRARGRPPTVSQVAEVIGDVGGATTTAGAVGGTGAVGASTASLVALGLGITGLGLLVGGMVAVASSDDSTPATRGDRPVTVADVPVVNDTPDPLNDVHLNEQTANFINNMDDMYRQQGYNDADIRTVHQAEADGIRSASSNQQLQNNLVDIQGQYIEDRSQALSGEGIELNEGHTANTGGGGGGLIDTTGGEETTPILDNDPGVIQDTSGNTANSGGGNGIPVLINPVPDESVISDVKPQNPEPYNPSEPGAPIDIGADTNFRGTGYSYYSFMNLPLWLRRKLLGKLIEDDY